MEVVVFGGGLALYDEGKVWVGLALVAIPPALDHAWLGVFAVRLGWTRSLLG